MMPKKDMKQINLPKIDWTGIRPIYRKLDAEFHVLTEGFGLQVPAQVREDMQHLIAAIDCVDRVLDDMGDAQQRGELSAAMISYVRREAEELTHQAVTAELKERLANLKKVVWHYHIVEPFSDSIEQVLEKTEHKRHVDELKTFLELVEQEGHHTAQLPLSIMGEYASTDFGRFFTRFCGLMGIADLLFDARADYRDGQLHFRPGLGVYLTVAGIVIREGCGLLYQFPRKGAFVGYCVRFLGVLLQPEKPGR